MKSVHSDEMRRIWMLLSEGDRYRLLKFARMLLECRKGKIEGRWQRWKEFAQFKKQQENK